MTLEAVNILLLRLPREEGRKQFAYNDATGKRVTCQPGGNLSIGEGTNLEFGLLPEEIDFITQNRVKKMDVTLSRYPWYTGANFVRQSVFLDVAFNGGLEDLMDYPHMISCAAKDDWDGASENLTEKEPSLDASRYAPLRKLLKDGTS